MDAPLVNVTSFEGPEFAPGVRSVHVVGRVGLSRATHRIAYCSTHAAAPDLLAALREIAEMTKRRSLPLTTQINDAARAAIRKATEPS